MKIQELIVTSTVRVSVSVLYVEMSGHCVKDSVVYVCISPGTALYFTTVDKQFEI